MTKRIKTNYPGVYYRNAKRAGGGVERVYYIVFKKAGKTIEEKTGRQYQDDMTPARASRIRSERMEGRRKSRKEIQKEADKRRAQTMPYYGMYFMRRNRAIKASVMIITVGVNTLKSLLVKNGHLI